MIPVQFFKDLVFSSGSLYSFSIFNNTGMKNNKNY